MDVSLLADVTESAHDSYDFWKDIIIPVATQGFIALFVGLAGVYASIQTFKNSETYRRLSHWEPYSEKLWEQRMDLYIRFAPIARDAIDKISILIDYAHDDGIMQVALRKAYDSKLHLRDVHLKSFSISGPDVVAGINDFIVALTEYEKMQPPAINNVQTIDAAMNRAIIAMRDELHVTAVDAKAKVTMIEIMDSIKRPMPTFEQLK